MLSDREIALQSEIVIEYYVFSPVSDLCQFVTFYNNITGFAILPGVFRE